MAKFKFIGDVETIFHGLIHPDGSTVVATPGQEVEVDHTINDNAANHPELEPLDDAATKMQADAKEKAAIAASREFGEVQTDVVDTATGLVPEPPAAPEATSTPPTAPPAADAETPPAS